MFRTHVFAYGSNLDPERMSGRVSSARVVGLASLSRFQLRFHKRGWKDGTAKANAFRTDDAAHVVHGVIYEVDESELADLDVHETGYERRRLDFAVRSVRLDGSTDTTILAAWIYLATADVIDDEILPRRWYVDHVIKGAIAHGLPRTLAEQLERQPSLD